MNHQFFTINILVVLGCLVASSCASTKIAATTTASTTTAVSAKSPAQPAVAAAPSAAPSAASFAAPSAASANDRRSFWHNRSDLIAAPAPAKAAALKLPPYQSFTLPNGLQVLLLADRRLPLIDMQLALRAGSFDDPAGKAGLANFTLNMLRHGTKSWDAEAISQRIDSAGADLSIRAGTEASSLICSGRRETAKLCLETLSEMVQRPTFPEKEMSEVRDMLLSAVKSTFDHPSALVRAHLANQLYSDAHPAGRPISVETVQGITQKDLVKFHQHQIVPSLGFLGISGDFEPAEMEKLVRRYFKNWRKAPAPSRNYAPLQDPPSLRVLLIDKPDLTQSFFALGHSGVKRTDPNRVPLQVLNYILGGGGFSSRLMQSVRAEGGKTYSIHSNFEMGETDGTFIIGSFTRHDQLLNTLQLVRQEMQRLTKQAPPTEKELSLAQGDMAGGYGISLMTSARIVAELLRVKLFDLPQSFVTDYALQVEAVKLAQLKPLGQTHLRPDHLVIVILGRADIVAPQLKKAGWNFSTIPYLSPISAAQRDLAKSAPLSK